MVKICSQDLDRGLNSQNQGTLVANMMLIDQIMWEKLLLNAFDLLPIISNLPKFDWFPQFSAFFFNIKTCKYHPKR